MSYCSMLKDDAANIISGSVLKSDTGIDLFTPDGFGTYPSLWTRDFAYMVEYAGDLIPAAKQKACIEYLLNGARESDGWIPDRVDTESRPFYTAGGKDFPALPNLDNGPFLIIAADSYLRQLPEEEAKIQFGKWKSALCRGIDCLDTDENGLIVNLTDPPHSPYGFTDTIRKTGKLAMESLLLWRGLRIINGYCREEKYASRQQSIEQSFASVFSSENGMLYAATGCCRQIDIWASCYAVSIGFPLEAGQKNAIADFLASDYDGIVMSGQIRHLPRGEYWEKTLVPVGEGEYQNGAYWATASGWFYDAIYERYPELAERLIKELYEFIRREGAWECINRNGYRKLKPYVVSVTNLYGTCKKHGL